MPTIRWEQVKDLVDAVLDLPPDARIAYLDQACSESPIRNYVESLVLSYENANMFFDEPAFVKFPGEVEGEERSSWIGRRVGPYQILEEIGEGGMGSVYRASRADDQYRKEVAIKVVRAGLDTRVALARFKSERQILADLDHPNIARLLDGGSTEEGQPYFVMDYIHGEPLDQYCDQHKLTVTERLHLFRAVCSAVQCAHQKLVIHRDIKPSNILVTDDGVPKLLDFGIAKLLAPESSTSLPDQTQTFVRLLTPEYASPEQWRGEMITTASDVYSLGVVLYELLTGRRPHRLSGRTSDEIDRLIATADTERPSAAITRVEDQPDASPTMSAEAVSATREGTPDKLRRRLMGDLDNIILKAIRKEPQRRYSSVEQLSEDIRRHLDGLPVLARKDTFSYRAAKFVRRHAAAVTAAALVLVSLSVGLVVAVREAAIARAQRARAEQRFKDVRDLANSLMFGVYDSVEDLPGATAARQLIVQKALYYLDSLSHESQEDPALQRELATAYKRIGDVQGNSKVANLGDSAGALMSYQKALEIRKTLFEAKQATLGDSVNYAEALRMVAEALLLNGKTADAWKHSQRATEVAETSERTNHDDRQLLQELSQDYSTQAAILGGNFNLSNLGNPTEAVAIRQKQVSVQEKLLSLQPNDAVAQRSFAVSLARMGDQYILVGQRREALANYLRAEKIFENLFSGSPSRKALDALDSIYVRLNVAQEGLGDLEAGFANANKALEISKKLSVADPKDFRARASLAIDYSNLADLDLASDQPSRAVLDSNHAIAIVDKLVAEDPSNGELPSLEGSVDLTKGDALNRTGEAEKSLPYYRRAMQIFARIHSRDPDNVDGSLQLAGAYNQLGKALVHQGQYENAVEVFQKALALSQPLSHVNHPSEESLYTVAEAYNGLGDAAAAKATSAKNQESRLENLNQARSRYQDSLNTWALVKEPGSLTPGGYDCVRPSDVRQHLEKVNRAINHAGNGH
jgi:serine/threonine protein kinase/tetratricopeptide (TPR) repeat protein